MSIKPTIAYRPRPWLRWGLMTLAGLAVLVVIALFGFSFWLNSYLHSDAFRSLVGQKTAAFLHADGEYMPFHWSGVSVYSDGYIAHGKPGAAFTDLKADQLRAEFHPQGVFHHAWQINDLTMQRLQLTLGQLGIPRPDLPVEASPQSSWIPDRLEVKHAQIQEASLNWTPTNSAGSVRGMRVVIEPEDQAWIVQGYGGELRQANWPAMTVDYVRLRYRHSEVFINDALLKLSDSENVALTGQINFAPTPTVDLSVKSASVNIAPYLPVDWRARLKGTAAIDAKITGPLGAVQATGKVTLTNGQLEALPVLDRIALFTQTEQFRHITLQKAEAEFVWTRPKLTVSHLVMESEGLLRVEGDFVVEARQLTGTFQVGVTPGSLRWLPGSQTRVFTVERGGYVWTTMHLSGPVDQLKEDLSERLIAAAGTEIIEGVKGTVEKGTDLLRDLLKPVLP